MPLNNKTNKQKKVDDDNFLGHEKDPSLSIYLKKAKL